MTRPTLMSTSLGLLQDTIGIAGDIAGYQSSKPRSMIGNATPSAYWQAGQCYVTSDWLAPSLEDVKAFDNYVSIYGYNQSGRKIDLSGNKYMSRNNFTYLKTEDANINGDLGIYKSAIETVFNNGIRFWDSSFASAGTIGSFPDGVITSNTPR